MGQRVVRRPARELTPSPQPEVRKLAEPPPAPGAQGAGRGVLQALLPATGGFGMLLFIIARGNPIFLLAGALIVMATIGGAVAVLISRRTGARRQSRVLRDRYLEYLEQEREQLREAARRQADHAARVHPHPAALSASVQEPGRLWERRPADPDFLQLRVGLGTVPRAVGATLPPSRTPLDLRDPVSERAAEQLVAAHTTLHHQPILVDLAGAASTTVVGPPDRARQAARVLVAQLAAWHAPGEVRVALCYPHADEASWSWLKWLPHLLDPDARDGVAPRRLAASTLGGLRAELDQELAERLDSAVRARRLGAARRTPPRRRLVVLVDETRGPQPGDLDLGEAEVTWSDLGVSVVRLVTSRVQEPGEVDQRVVVDGDAVTVEWPGAERAPQTGVLDGFGEAEVEALGRALAPLRLVAEALPDEPMVATTGLSQLLGVADPARFDVAALWQPRELRDFLRVPIGIRADGSALMLDLKESAYGGMGPHGVCVGATGSGKSELLRTLVLALAMTHPPDRLALLLVDYKGGATFAGMEQLPHTAGLITNLSDDLGLVDRMREALYGELRRRQQILLDAGNLPNVTEYNRRRDAGQPLEPLPNLLVIVDEFAELLTAKPDFLELFIALGRIGRSIGVHQLLASQRLEEGRLRGLESYLSYRIGLRTFNALESRAVLGVPDAYELPPVPGSGYLKVDTTVFERFKAAYVSGAYEGPSAAASAVPAARCEPFSIFNQEPRDRAAADGAAGGSEEPDPAPDARDRRSVLETTVARLAEADAGTDVGVRQVWLPPLPSSLALEEVVGPLTTDPDRGLQLAAGSGSRAGGSAEASRFGRLRVPVGLLDIPAEQRQEPFVLDLTGSGGHLAVIGAPQSGKSSLLRVLVTAATLTHTPGEVAFYCVDLGGGTLGPLVELPHVGGVCGRRDPDRLRRTVHEVATMLGERERVFQERGIDSAAEMRRLWRAGELPELPSADVFLVIDNYAAIRQDYEDLVDVVTDVANRGLTYGVHVVVATSRWQDFRPPLQGSLGGRVELRLADPYESTINRKLAANIRSDQPGRCLTAGGLSAQVAWPQFGGYATLDDLYKALNRAWPGLSVPPVRLLPTSVAYDAVVSAFEAASSGVPGAARGVAVGVGEDDLRPVTLDLFGEDTHVIVLGDQGCGKTTFLRTLVRGHLDRHSDQEVVFAVIDPRRSMLGFVPDNYLGGYAPSPAVADKLAQSVAAELATRMPGGDVTPDQLRERSWWSGPEIVVLVDDLDLLAGARGASPLVALHEYLPHARDIGLHVVVARHSGGAGRALFQPFLQRLRELGATGLVMRGDRQEGQLWPGVYLSALPPGRGQLARRQRRPLLIQVAQLPD